MTQDKKTRLLSTIDSVTELCLQTRSALEVGTDAGAVPELIDALIDAMLDGAQKLHNTLATEE